MVGTLPVGDAPAVVVAAAGGAVECNFPDALLILSKATSKMT